LGPEVLAAVNPRLVMLSASTYGEAAMDGSYVGYAPVFSALGGLAHATGYPDGPPVEVSHPVDFFCGLVGVLGIVAGLHRLAATGRGCRIDLSAREVVLWSLSDAMLAAQSAPTHRDSPSEGRLGNGHPEMAPHGVYRCRGENRWLSLAVGSDAQWQALCACMGEDKLAADASLADARGRCLQRDRIDAVIGHWTCMHDDQPLAARLQAAGVAAFASVTPQDLWADPHLRARGVFEYRQAGRQGRWHVAPPWRLRGAPRTPLRTVNGGEAFDAVFAGLLQKKPHEIQSLLAEGVIARRH
jgi:benzylsuccinate CoA-transferase BbsF subunit